MEYGKLPPQAVDLEKAVLGALLIESEAIDSVIAIIHSADVFYEDKHQHVYQALVSLYYENTPIDLLTTTEQLKKSGKLDAAGGYFYIATLTNEVASAAHIETHARVVLEKWMLRQTIAESTELIKMSFDDTSDAIDVLGMAVDKFDRITNVIHTVGVQDFGGAVIRVTDELKQLAIDKKVITGLTTGSDALNMQMLGMQKSDLIIVAARPGVGKTGVMLHIAKKQAQTGVPVLYFSLEMSTEQLIGRMIDAECGVSAARVVREQVQTHEWAMLDRSAAAIGSLPMFIEDTPGLTATKIVAIAKSYKKKYNIGAVYIDYLGLMDDEMKGFGNDNSNIAKRTKRLKQAAKQLDIPFVLGSQLSRKCEERVDKRPVLSDLRDSGAIEQDADVVIFLYRPEKDFPEYPDGESTKGITELNLAKFRNGRVGTIRWEYDNSPFNYKDYNEFKRNEPPQQYKKITPRASWEKDIDSDAAPF